MLAATFALIAAGAAIGPQAQLDQAVRASWRVEDVRARVKLEDVLAGARLQWRGVVAQDPDGSPLRAQTRVTESFAGRRRRSRYAIVVVGRRIFVRTGGGRWRRVEDTSPQLSYDEALALVARTEDVRRTGVRRYRGTLDFSRTQSLEPLRLLDETPRAIRVDVTLDRRGRVRRFSLAARAEQQSLRARVAVRAFDRGLTVTVPRR